MSGDLFALSPRILERSYLGGLDLNKKLEAFQLISSIGWLSEQPADFRDHLLTEASVRIFPPGKMLFEAGAPVHALVGIASGSVELLLEHPQLNLHAFHIGKRGAWFGEHVALGLPTWKMSARVRTETCAVAVSKQAIKGMIGHRPEYLKNFGLLSHLHVRECSKVIVELLQQDSFFKVCARLTTLAVAHAADASDTSGGLRNIEVPITHDELSAICGISRRTLERILVELKAAGAIKVTYGAIVIPSSQKLGKITSGDRALIRKSAPVWPVDIAAAE